jgi:hypothetical protein
MNMPENEIWREFEDTLLAMEVKHLARGVEKERYPSWLFLALASYFARHYNYGPKELRDIIPGMLEAFCTNMTIVPEDKVDETPEEDMWPGKTPNLS